MEPTWPFRKESLKGGKSTGKTLTGKTGKTALAAVDGAGAGPSADTAVDADDESAPPLQIEEGTA